MFGIRDNENCDLCNTPETICHFLYECPLANNIWLAVENWLNTNTNSVIYFDKESIFILGNPKNAIVTNCIILIVKHEMYKLK